MNSSVYIFGELSSGYIQYPEDSSSNVLKTLYSHCKVPTQTIIHRDGSMMFYCYIRKLDANKYIGLCVAINGYYVSKVDELFSLFENTIEKMARQGVFIHFVADGALTTNLKDLKFEEEEIDTLSENLRLGFETLGNVPQKLPHTDYTIAKDSVKEFCVSDDKHDIIRASYTYGFTYIYKEKDFDTVRMNSYRSVLRRVNEENVSLKKRNAELQEQNKKILNQKKQYRNVVILCILIAVCGIGLFFLKDSLDSTRNNLDSTRNKLENAQNNITQKAKTIKTLNKKIANLQTSLSEETSRREKAENDFSKLKSSFENYIPVIITDVQIANVYNDGSVETDYGGTIYSSSSMYVKPKITYEGIKTSENITLNIKLYTPTGISRGSSSPPGCSWTESFNVYSGSNTKSFQGWGGASKGHWRSGTYRYEFWYGNVCLKAKTFTIY